MTIYDYCTSGGKNLITEYIEALPPAERVKIYQIRANIAQDGLSVLLQLNTRQLKGKLYEIKIDRERIMYILSDADNIYFLHICRKQKGKAAKRDIKTALSRAKAEGLI
jgi:phage-related protein